MHHALEIPEILLNIFCAYRGYRTRSATFGLASLAGICRAFKEPALDVLWEDLYDLSPLVRCLPEASQRLNQTRVYSFNRPLTDTEWDILRSYTRRIRSILDMRSNLDRESLMVLSNPPNPDSEPLFPNLHRLRCKYTTEAIPLSHHPIPSLLSLDLHFRDARMFQKYFESFSNFSPNVKSLVIAGMFHEKIDPDYFCQWKNLRTVCCRRITLDESTLTHLSRMPALTRLGFTPNATLRTLDSPLSFFNLDCLSLDSESLALVTSFLSRTQLPVITDFATSIKTSPSTGDIFSFLTCLQTSNAAHTLDAMCLTQSRNTLIDRALDAPVLGLNDLRPCMAFSNLRYLHLDVPWNVGLTDSELLTLGSAWPHLEQLCVNEDWSWNTHGITHGITPNGLLQLLEMCRSLRRIALAFDVRGYTEFTPSPEGAGAGFKLTSPPTCICVDVLDSAIETACIPAVAAFFASIVPCNSDFSFSYWRCECALDDYLGWEQVYWERWEEVRKLVTAILVRTFSNHVGNI